MADTDLLANLPDETAQRLLDALMKVKDPESFRTVVGALLHRFFDEATAWGWRQGLEAFAGSLDQGMRAADAAGIPARTCAVDVTDLIMAAREMATKPPSPAPQPLAVCTGTGTMATDLAPYASSSPTEGACGICGQRVKLADGQRLVTHPYAPPSPAPKGTP